MSNERANFWTRRQETPTYEVVGKLERYDLRDERNNRAALVPGTERYRAYYTQRPEWEEKDQKYRALRSTCVGESQRRELFGSEPLALALSNACHIASALDGSGYGPVAGPTIELDPQMAAKNIKGVARYFGADLVGICKLNPAWVYSHYGGSDDRDGHWGDPIEINHPYAIAIACAHNFEMLLSGRGIGLMPAIETNEVCFSQAAVAAMRLASYIRALGYPADVQQPPLAGLGRRLLVIPVAIDAGLGEEGRNGSLITKEYGPAVRLGIVSTTLPMAVDKPVDIGVQDLCAKCFKCADTCSSGSISRGDKEVVRGVKKWPVDGETCSQLRASQGGAPVCFNCLSACPWTKPHNFIHQSAAWLAARFSVARTALIWLDDVLYGKRPRQHPFPDWLEYDKQKLNFKERLSLFLHKI